MSKTVDIDLSDDRLIAIAADMIDDHNYIGALKMLNKNAELTGNDEDSYMLYAEAFDDMGLYERSIHHWFKFLDVAEFNDLADCYEGLAVGYMNLGNEQFSAYYYNKLLLETDEVDAETREQIVSDFLSEEDEPLKFSYPPEIADVTDIMNDGISLMKQNEFDKALEKFSEVAEGNPKWGTARNYMAMCHIVNDRCDLAEEECRTVLKRDPGNVQALSTLAAVKTEEGKKDEARELTEQLLKLGVTDRDDLYKIATVCCENGMHAEAYSLFCKMDGDVRYDKNLLYFKAISSFNARMFDKSFAAFDELLTIYPDSPTAQFYYNIARTMREKDAFEELSYFYNLPQEVKQASLKVLAAFLKLGKQQAVRLADELNIDSHIKWCFDEGMTGNTEKLQSLAARVAIKARSDDYVRDLLLHPFLPDSLKLDILELLCERAEDNNFGVVICNVYKRVTMKKLNTGAKKRGNFRSAYARLVAHFSIIDDSYGDKFIAAAENLYGKLEADGRLDAASDTAALTAAIFGDANITDTGITKENLCAFFGITEEQLQNLRGE